MMKYFKLYIAFLKNNVKKDILYRFNFYVNFFTIFMNYLFNIIFYILIYSKVKSIGGWSLYQVMALIGTTIILDSIFGGIFFFNLIRVPRMIRNYELDYIILKPIDNMFLLSTRYFNSGIFSGILFGITILIYALIKLKITFSITSVLIYLILIINALVIMYCIFAIFISFSFKFVKIDGLIQMFWSIMEFGKQPESIYSNLVRNICSTIIPVLIVYNLPVKYILSNTNVLYYIPIIGATMILLLLTRKLWNKCIVYYYQ